ncbi:PREDICTED: uncharacterized protein LOC106810918 [Priapulus caudatus]|uniref:Uncharacterized protein LOC106810918 n=1 Tax=Priapulus caudatus TaxID=37621 RepID=A0ABM1ECG0_PRICU|nr:PREDICTED: uncharacterized protein LOC106810918 [Priapulus caudatus]XP_014669882.1 PREDICTED: uncharacterized protein LOC106810918 [Priapulus caudatus]
MQFKKWRRKKLKFWKRATRYGKFENDRFDGNLSDIVEEQSENDDDDGDDYCAINTEMVQNTHNETAVRASAVIHAGGDSDDDSDDDDGDGAASDRPKIPATFITIPAEKNCVLYESADCIVSIENSINQKTGCTTPKKSATTKKKIKKNAWRFCKTTWKYLKLGLINMYPAVYNVADPRFSCTSYGTSSYKQKPRYQYPDFS